VPSKPHRGFRPPTAYEALAITMAFLALGGGSYAAISVTGKNVKNSSLTGRDVKNNSLTGSDVKGLSSGSSRTARCWPRTSGRGSCRRATRETPGPPG
jgi:hypothetical protein